MSLYPTLADLLDSQLPADLTMEFIQGEHDIVTLTPAELKTRALSLLGTLQARGMTPGHELVIHTQSNVDFVVAFWAAVIGGLVPVPVAVGISDEHRGKLLRIIQQLKQARLFTTDDLWARFSDYCDRVGIPIPLDDSALIKPDDRAQDDGRPHAASPDDLAFIQYSSGSTGSPKGVCLTHKNVTTNIRAIIDGAGWNANDRALSWMPLTHDMGLIGFHLSVLGAGMSHAIMDTSVFVRRPKLWLSMAAERNTTLLCSPNFGYQHLLKAVERKGLDQIDLSHVRQVMNGAEPISRELCDTFNAALAPLGLSSTAMMPVYGLAEATVGVTFTATDEPYASTRVDRDHLAIGDTLREVPASHADAIDLMHVGRPIQDVQLRLVDNNDADVAANTVGHIQLRGGSVTSSIYGDEDTTQALFTSDGWLKTGDSGAMISDGQLDPTLVIVGRIKDVLISNGQNFYAHDIEDCIRDIAGAELGKVAVASVQRPDSPVEQVAVFVVYRKELEEFAPLAHEIRAAVSARAGLDADFIVPVPRMPKTTSGKIQRRQLADAFMHGEFDHTLDAKGVRHGVDADPEAASPEASDDAGDVVSQLVSIAKDHVTEGQIGPDDNLFEIGVSSLTLTEIALAIEERFPGKLDVSDLFDYPTLRELSAWVQRD